jgi:hypothetical protein
MLTRKAAPQSGSVAASANRADRLVERIYRNGRVCGIFEGGSDIH